MQLRVPNGDPTVTSASPQKTVKFVVPGIFLNVKAPALWTVTGLVQFSNVKVLIGPPTSSVLKGLTVDAAMADEVHVLANDPSVRLMTIEVPDARLASMVTDSFFATPPTSNVVAEALPAVNAAMAIAATTPKPSFFTCFMSSPIPLQSIWRCQRDLAPSEILVNNYCV